MMVWKGRSASSVVFQVVMVILALMQVLNFVKLNETNECAKHILDLPRSSENPSIEIFNATNTRAPLAETISNPSSHCFYRKFPYTEVDDGLPWLFDAFADAKVEHAMFVGIHRGEVKKSYVESDSFFTSDPSTNRTHHFLCLFQGTIPVWSEAMHPTGFKDNGRPWAHSRAYVIRCRIPPELKGLIEQGQTETKLRVNLVSLLHPANPSRVSQSQLISDLPTLSNIPICHPLSNAADGSSRQLKANQFQLLAHTEVRSSYLPTREKSFVSDALSRLEEWIDYHRYQGVQHFVIYDNDPEDHGPLETALAPYVARGLVTRVWNPMEKLRPEDDPKRNPKAHVQCLIGQSAMWRYGHTTKWFANMDIDEFFLLQDSTTRLETFLPTSLANRPSMDGMLFDPYVITYCNGAILPKEELEAARVGAIASSDEKTTKTSNVSPSWSPYTHLAAKKCRTTSRIKGSKLIFLADRIWLWNIHNAFLTDRYTKPNLWKVPESQGFLGHYRRDAYSIKPLSDDPGKVLIQHKIEHKEPSMAMLKRYMETRTKVETSDKKGR